MTGFLSTGIELLVFLSLMELPPFHKGDSDIIWGLPFFCLLVLGLAIPGFLAAIALKNSTPSTTGIVLLGLIMNGLSLAIPFLLLRFTVIRAFLQQI